MIVSAKSAADERDGDRQGDGPCNRINHPRRELCHDVDDLALCNLHARLERSVPGTGFQLARRATRGGPKPIIKSQTHMRVGASAASTL